MSFRLKRRAREEIISAILTESEIPILKTELMRKVNISFKQLDKYLSLLKERRLITEEKKHLKTTEKGKKYIEAFKQLQKLLRPLN